MARGYRRGGYRRGGWPSDNDLKSYFALETPVQQLMRENRKSAPQRALQRIRDEEARKAVEGDTDVNHDNEELPRTGE